MVGNKRNACPKRILNGAKIELNSFVHAWISIVQFLNCPFLPAPYIAAEPGRAKISPSIYGGRKGEFRNWTRISTDPTATLTLNYTEKVSKMRNILSCWELTLIGKIQVIKRLPLSQLIYISTPLATNQKFINEINDIFIVFCNWNNKRSCCVKFPSVGYFLAFHGNSFSLVL